VSGLNMEGNAPLLRFRALLTLICISIALGVTAGACGGAPVHAENPSGHSEGGSGCHTYIRGVLRRILPKTSNLSCSGSARSTGSTRHPGSYLAAGTTSVTSASSRARVKAKYRFESLAAIVDSHATSEATSKSDCYLPECSGG
jgi:hypothetical protein